MSLAIQLVFGGIAGIQMALGSAADTGLQSQLFAAAPECAHAPQDDSDGASGGLPAPDSRHSCALCLVCRASSSHGFATLPALVQVVYAVGRRQALKPTASRNVTPLYTIRPHGQGPPALG